jgi:hypothetical protein
MKTTTNTTAEVLAAMFTENTGTHLLDSGGAYGRHWERNQGKTVDDFLAHPGQTIDEWGVTLDAFFWLYNRLEFDPVMDAAFNAFLDQDDEMGYLEAMEEFPKTLGGENVYTVNTYNGDSALSQTLQWTQWELNGQTYYALQVHGGCDVRGGYTRPRVFTGDDYGLHDFERYSLTCWECEFSVEYWAGSVEDGNIENKIPNDQPPAYGRDWQPSDGCPCCRKPL